MLSTMPVSGSFRRVHLMETRRGPLPIRLILNARGGAAKSAPLCTAFEVASETLVFTTLTLDLPNDLAPVALHAVAVGKVRIIGADGRHACPNAAPCRLPPRIVGDGGFCLSRGCRAGIMATTEGARRQSPFGKGREERNGASAMVPRWTGFSCASSNTALRFYSLGPAAPLRLNASRDKTVRCVPL